jgi:hypothetical protein
MPEGKKAGGSNTSYGNRPLDTLIKLHGVNIYRVLLENTIPNSRYVFTGHKVLL